MSGSARSEIFSRLRKASRGETEENIQRERLSLGSAPTPTPPAPEHCQAFILNVLKNQGSVDCVSNRSEAVKAIAHYLYAHFHNYRLVPATTLVWRPCLGGMREYCLALVA
jgi:L-lactate dehydrogenase complex protein LldG